MDRFNSAYEQHKDKLRKFVMRKVGSDVDDILVDIWFDYYRKCDQIDEKFVLMWLYKASKFAILTHKSRKKVTYALDGVDVPTFDNYDYGLYRFILQRLPPDLKIIYYYTVQGYTRAEIALKTALNARQVRYRVEKLRSCVREILLSW